MFLGALVTWSRMIPDVQYADRKSKTLEELVFVRQQQSRPAVDIEMSSEAGSIM